LKFLKTKKKRTEIAGKNRKTKKIIEKKDKPAFVGPWPKSSPDT
jgi:hypothetical protein